MLALVGLAAGLLTGSGPARAAASDWSATEQTKVRLIAAASRVGSAQTLRLGLEFKMKPGWKIYWRSPGDAGFPPRIDWSGSTNVASAAIAWPAPQRFTVLGFNTTGYKKEVILPLTVRLSQPGRPARLRASVNYLTCAEICIPYTATLALDLPAGPAQTSAFAYRIDRYRARVPTTEALAGITVFTTYTPDQPVAPGPGGGPNKNLPRLCSRTGKSKVFAVMTTNANGVLFDTNNDRTRSIGVDTLIGKAFADLSATQNAPSSGGGSPPPPPDPLPPNRQLIFDELKKLFPSNCRFANYRIDIRAIASDTEIVEVAPVPVCIIEKNWREF